jgi:hypothetical protein
LAKDVGTMKLDCVIGVSRQPAAMGRLGLEMTGNPDQTQQFKQRRLVRRQRDAIELLRFDHRASVAIRFLFQDAGA